MTDRNPEQTLPDRLATSTNIVSFRRDGGKTPMVELIPLLAKTGWKRLDLNFCEMMNPSSILCTDRWMSYVDALSELKDRYGLSYIQSHAPYAYDRFALTASAGTTSDSLVLRAIEASAILGVRCAVVHPAKGSDGFDSSRLREMNVRWLSRFVDLAEKRNVTIALENLDAIGEIREADELCALVDAIDSPHVGVCYDFGHAHLGGQDHRANLLTYGSRLVATHVADNHGAADEHLLPFYGTLPWEICMKTLKEIGYAGFLTYEVMFFTRNLPEALKPSMLRHAMDAGRYLCDLMEQDEQANDRQ
jgi:sugar phosphate isomerase/epimerase